ncbi:Hypothetical predicted protein [Lynx pardinus]|uniref:Uncharacterized protein n=1 Tax=Lynx pardinus TaxID=191816 RepID=A0A485MRA3_LYNPA|nr:Hypothetical predicted protein [Lynx pardinus]
MNVITCGFLIQESVKNMFLSLSGRDSTHSSNPMNDHLYQKVQTPTKRGHILSVVSLLTPTSFKDRCRHLGDGKRCSLEGTVLIEGLAERSFWDLLIEPQLGSENCDVSQRHVFSTKKVLIFK